MKPKQMMIYSCREFDELPLFQKFAAKYGFTFRYTTQKPTMDNIHLAEGCPYVNVITTPIDRTLLEQLHRQGCSYIVTRTIGYDHIDGEAAQEFGFRIANTPYAPDGVAEYTVMLMLMCIRKMRSIDRRFSAQDFTLNGLIGRELSELTVGVLGTGRIGTRLIEILSGFGCRILAYSPHPNEKAAKYATYVSLDELCAQSDILSLHAPSTTETFHMVDEKMLSKCKDGVILINTARGALVDTMALITALESGKVGGAGVDVVEDESKLYYYDRRETLLHNKGLALLNSYSNVIVTHHMAFYTEQCVETMVRDSLRGAVCDAEERENPWRVQ